MVYCSQNSSTGTLDKFISILFELFHEGSMEVGELGHKTAYHLRGMQGDHLLKIISFHSKTMIMESSNQIDQIPARIAHLLPRQDGCAEMESPLLLSESRTWDRADSGGLQQPQAVEDIRGLA